VVRALIDLEGIEKVRVFWPEGTVKILYDPRLARPEGMADALEKAGFPAALTECRKNP